MAGDKRVKLVSFTGSTAVGKSVAMAVQDRCLLPPTDSWPPGGASTCWSWAATMLL